VLVTCPSSLCATCQASWLRCSHDDGEFPCCFQFAWMFAAWACVISAPCGTTVPFECAHDEPFQSLALFSFIHFSPGGTGGTDAQGRSGPASLASQLYSASQSSGWRDRAAPRGFELRHGLIDVWPPDGQLSICHTNVHHARTCGAYQGTTCSLLGCLINIAQIARLLERITGITGTRVSKSTV